MLIKLYYLVNPFFPKLAVLRAAGKGRAGRNHVPGSSAHLPETTYFLKHQGLVSMCLLGPGWGNSKRRPQREDRGFGHDGLVVG